MALSHQPSTDESVLKVLDAELGEVTWIACTAKPSIADGPMDYCQCLAMA